MNGCATCGCGQCGLLSGLLGDLTGPAVDQDARFQFGFENAFGQSTLFGSYDWIATALEDAGISYDTRAFYIAGVINPYVNVEGRTTTGWNSSNDLYDAIYNVLVANNVWINFNANSPKLNVEQSQAQPGAAAPPVVTVAPPSGGAGGSGGGGNVPHDATGGCSYSQMNFPDWVACKLGVTTTSATIIGAVVGIGLFIAITRR